MTVVAATERRISSSNLHFSCNSFNSFLSNMMTSSLFIDSLCAFNRSRASLSISFPELLILTAETAPILSISAVEDITLSFNSIILFFNKFNSLLLSYFILKFSKFSICKMFSEFFSSASSASLLNFIMSC